MPKTRHCLCKAYTLFRKFMLSHFQVQYSFLSTWKNDIVYEKRTEGRHQPLFVSFAHGGSLLQASARIAQGDSMKSKSLLSCILSHCFDCIIGNFRILCNVVIRLIPTTNFGSLLFMLWFIFKSGLVSSAEQLHNTDYIVIHKKMLLVSSSSSFLGLAICETLFKYCLAFRSVDCFKSYAMIGQESPTSLGAIGTINTKSSCK